MDQLPEWVTTTQKTFGLHVEWAGERVKLDGKQAYIVGRSSKCDVVLKDSGLSRFQLCVGLTDNNKVQIQDLMTSNDSSLNGVGIADAPRQLLDGQNLAITGKDRIQLRMSYIVPNSATCAKQSTPTTQHTSQQHRQNASNKYDPLSMIDLEPKVSDPQNKGAGSPDDMEKLMAQFEQEVHHNSTENPSKSKETKQQDQTTLPSEKQDGEKLVGSMSRDRARAHEHDGVERRGAHQEQQPRPDDRDYDRDSRSHKRRYDDDEDRYSKHRDRYRHGSDWSRYSDRSRYDDQRERDRRDDEYRYGDHRRRGSKSKHDSRRDKYGSSKREVDDRRYGRDKKRSKHSGDRDSPVKKIQTVPDAVPVSTAEQSAALVRKMMGLDKVGAQPVAQASTQQGALSVQEKKALLWGKKKEEDASFGANRWDAAEFTNSDEKQKFMHLMGVKEGAAVNEPPETGRRALTGAEQAKVLANVSQQYEAGLRRADGRTVGLGL